VGCNALLRGTLGGNDFCCKRSRLPESCHPPECFVPQKIASRSVDYFQGIVQGVAKRDDPFAVETGESATRT
jgi:hypothetical protein